ncbi:MAG: ABC transporter permease [Eubacteriales bacterium]
MDFLPLLKNVLEEGFIYGLMALGVYVTYKILDFPDLSVDGTFPLGGCLTAILITQGVNPWLCLLLAFLAGGVAGCCTGLLHVKCKITDLLSGIIVMTALYSINMVVLGGVQGKAVLQFFNQDTIFNSGIITLLPEGLRPYRVLILTGILVLVGKLVLDLFLSTRCGLLLRATGDNPAFVTSLAKSQGNMKILGLALGNGFTAMSGSVLAQQLENSSTAIGTGMVVQGLAAVIIGASLCSRFGKMKGSSTAILGCVVYKGILLLAMLYLPPVFLKLAMAALFLFVLMGQQLSQKTKKEVVA